MNQTVLAKRSFICLSSYAAISACLFCHRSLFSGDSWFATAIHPTKAKKFATYFFLGKRENRVDRRREAARFSRGTQSEDRFESHEVQRVRTLRRCPPPQTGHFLYRCVGDRGTRINDTMPEEISQWPIARRRIRRTLCRFRNNRPQSPETHPCMAQPLRVS